MLSFLSLLRNKLKHRNHQLITESLTPWAYPGIEVDDSTAAITHEPWPLISIRYLFGYLASTLGTETVFTSKRRQRLHPDTTTTTTTNSLSSRHRSRDKDIDSKGTESIGRHSTKLTHPERKKKNLNPHQFSKLRRDKKKKEETKKNPLPTKWAHLNQSVKENQQAKPKEKKNLSTTLVRFGTRRRTPPKKKRVQPLSSPLNQL